MSQLSLHLKTAPVEDPVTLAETKLHLRVDPDLTDDNTLIASMIKAATETAQAITRRQFVTATYELRFDSFPTVINFPRPPLASVVSVKYKDTAGDVQTFDAGKYEVDIYSTVGRIQPKTTESWPTTGDFLGAVIVEYTAGYGAATAVPDDIKSAILLMVGHLYEHREDVIIGVSAVPVPRGANDLLWPRRILGEIL